MLVTQDGDAWQGNSGYYRCRSRQLKQKHVEEAVMTQLMSDLRGEEFACVIATAYKAAGEEHNPAHELAKLDLLMSKASKKIENLMIALSEGKAKSSILSTIEKLEQEKQQLSDEYEAVRAMSNMSKTLRETTVQSVKRMMDAIVAGFDFSQMSSLRVALQSLLIKVVLNSDSLEAELHYKMITSAADRSDTGVSVASPRGAKLNPVTWAAKVAILKKWAA
jgi:hypothetical protein